MNKKILIAFFTKGGATEEYARIITESLTANGLSVNLVNLSHEIPELSDYDVIVLGTGVRMTMVYRRWRKILKQKAIKDKQLFLFLSSGMAAEDPDKAVEKYLQPLVEKYDLTVNSMISFPGKIPDKWAKYDDAPEEKINPQLAETWADNIANTIQKNK